MEEVIELIVLVQEGTRGVAGEEVWVEEGLDVVEGSWDVKGIAL